MGLDSETGWDLLYESEEKTAVDTLVKLCSHFLDAVPTLLGGR